MSNKSDDTKQKDVISAITNNPSNMVPKMANKVAVSKSSADNYILTFMFSNIDESPILVDRIVLDKNIVKSLTDLLNDSQDKSKK